MAFVLFFCVSHFLLFKRYNKTSVIVNSPQKSLVKFYNFFLIFSSILSLCVVFCNHSWYTTRENNNFQTL